jgi:hypothetical protein
VVFILEVSIKEPGLNGSKVYWPLNRVLIRFKGKTIFLNSCDRRKARDSGVGKDIFDIKIDSLLPSFTDQLDANDRVSSDFKEVIMNTNLLNFKDFCPDGRKSQFEG